MVDVAPAGVAKWSTEGVCICAGAVKCGWTGRGTRMTNAGERVRDVQQIATVLRREQAVALELLLMGHSYIEVGKSLGVRRETVWRWKQSDPVFRAALDERRESLADAAAERLRGLADQAVSVVQAALNARDADPKLAMALLSALGVLERGRALGQALAEPGARADTVDGEDEDAEVERVIEAVEGEMVHFAHIPPLDR